MVLDMNVNADYSSSYFLSTALDGLHKESGYTKLGAQMGLSGGDGAWRVSVIGDNLTDERVMVAGVGLPLGRTFVRLASGGALDGTAFYSFYQRPRNITLKLDYNF